MIKSVTRRWIVIPKFNLQPPKEVVDELKRLDKDLELIWNEDDGQWEFYRVTARAARRDDDTLAWQISAPFKGSIITPGIVNWLRSKDSTEGGKLSKKELEDKFVKFVRTACYDEKQRKIKMAEEYRYAIKPVFDTASVNRKQVSVPITVGFNKNTGRKIYAVKKQEKVLNVK